MQAVVAVSEQTLEEARPYLRADALQFVIHNGINLSRYHPLDDATRTANRQALGVAERFVMLFVGHEFERKRLDLVLEAIAALPPTVCLWVIGGRGSSSAQYADLARRLGVAERVQFLGTVNDAERYYQAADVFVLPSDYETWGLVVMEAMACGTPVLMTPVGCAPHVVRDGETGYLVDYHAQSIVEKVSVLLSDGARYAAMRRAARLAAEPYGWSGVARKYLDVVAAVRERMHGA
ncbi:glycosyltransferase [Niveibacterium microcysteis]|uniref:glycosyltransferase family 4 protein n=1 Tax=Niveibacterium microcysteis TaxID=2811415 RepID=UPI0031B5891D